MATAYQFSSGGFTPPPQRHKAAAAQLRTAPRGKKPAMVEFYTVKKIDNSRLVRHVEPVKMRNLYKTVALGGIVAAFCMFYIYQHFRCIDLSFQLEDLKAKTQQAQSLNSKLKLEIAYLRDPHRIDVIARRQLGLTQPTANQVREYANTDEAEVAAVQYVRPNHAP
jgi:cell division protein FtsL